MESFLVSIIMPVYNEEKIIMQNIKTVEKILVENNFSHELILIDDGSNDNTWANIMESSKTIKSIQAFRFSRNFGKESAICAGLEKVTGDAAIIIDADLQHPPELIPEMIGLWKNSGFEVVEGIKSSRGKEKIKNRIFASIFYGLLKRFSGFDLNRSSDFKLLDKKVVLAWKQMNEKNTFFRGMSTWVGYKRTFIPFSVKERVGGDSKWSFFTLVKLAITAITSFSSIPLQIITLIGSILLIFSFILAIQTLYLKLSGSAVTGFTTVILLLLIIGSSIMISLGIIGTYIAKIYDEVKGRPRYIIADSIENN